MRGVRKVRGLSGGVGHRHSKRRRLLGDRTADAADSDQAELFSAQLHAQHVVERPAAPCAGANHALAFAKPTRHREDERPGEICARVRQHVRRIGHGNAARAARRDIDVVVADRNVGDDLQLRSGGVQDGGVDGVGQQAHDRVLAGNAPQQFVTGNRLVARVEIDLANLFELADDS